ncbi:transposase [Tetragenococcus halophilus]
MATSRRVAMKATRSAGSLLFNDFQFIVTNFEGLDLKTIFQLYQKQGNMENFIKEMKGGFFAGKTIMIDTIRFKLFHLAGRMTEHARQIQIYLSNTNICDILFWDVLARIQRLNL